MTQRLGQFNPSQQEAALDLIDGMTWGNLGPAIHDVELCLRRALKATTRDLRNWENGDFEQRFGDEFSVSDAQVAELSDEERFAYVARLIDTAAVMYGLLARPSNFAGCAAPRPRQAGRRDSRGGAMKCLYCGKQVVGSTHVQVCAICNEPIGPEDEPDVYVEVVDWTQLEPLGDHDYPEMAELQDPDVLRLTGNVAHERCPAPGFDLSDARVFSGGAR
jgi:hypothetical protein